MSSATRRPSIKSAAKVAIRKVAISGYWSPLPVTNERFFVYGPKLGRMYFLPGDHLSDKWLLKLLGLNGHPRRPDLADPAMQVVHDRVSLRDDELPHPPFSMRLGYTIARRSHRFVPLALSVAIIRWLARLSRNCPRATVSEIGRMVCSVERATGIEECYPRALVTCYLCLRSQRACDLTIGALSPTRMMHIWCVTEGLLPYEAVPEHFMYQPLVTLTAAVREAQPAASYELHD